MERIGLIIAKLFGPLADRVADRIADRLEPKMPDLSDLDDQIVAKLPDLSNLPKQVAEAFTGVIGAIPAGGIAGGLPGLADNLTDFIRGMFTGKDKP